MNRTTQTIAGDASKYTSPSSAISTQVHYNFFIITSIRCRVTVLGKLFTAIVRDAMHPRY